MLTIKPHPTRKTVVTLEGNLSAKVFEAARNMPGRKKWQGRTLLFEPTRANIEYLQEQLPNIDWQLDRVAEIERIKQVEADAIEAKAAPLPPEAMNFRFKTTPFTQQLEAFSLSKNHEAFAIFLDPGLGKTKVMLDTAAHLWAEGRIDTLFVMAPNGVHRQWIEEQVPIHLPDFVKHKCLVYTSNHTKRFLGEVDDVLGYTDGLRIIAIHEQAFQSKKGIAFAERVLSSSRALWVIDESPSIKTPGAARTKAVLRLKKLAPYRRILTGTPVSKGSEDLYTQLRFLSDDILGFSSFYTFRNRYCITQPVPGAPRGAVQIVGYQNIDELKQKIDKWSIRRRLKDCIDMKTLPLQLRYIEMTDEQRRLYYAMKNDFVSQLKNGEIVSANQAIVTILRLQQILCGHVKDDNGVVHRIPTNKLSAALEIVQQVGPKVVIWARFKEDIDQLKEIMSNFNPVTYEGRTSIEDRGIAKRRFIDDPDCGPFIANQAAASRGLDGLQTVSHTSAFYSNTYKADERWQAQGRLERKGQLLPVLNVDLVVPRTIETQILKTLKDRKDFATKLIDIQNTFYD